MKIAQIAPLTESVPPRLYGGTERVVSYLTEELVELGHDVTLYASGDSITSARLVAGTPVATRFDNGIRDTVPHYLLMLDRILQKADAYDILHFHLDYLHFPLFRPLSHKVVTTLHGRQDIPDNKPLYDAFDEMPLISISDHQRRPIIQANFVATIPHGIPSHLLHPVTTPGSYLAFLGRISPEKRPDRAIAIAKASGIPLKIAAKVDRADQSYFDQIIRPLLDDPLIEFIGEIGEHEKSQFLGESLGLLFPIDWPEPFGLVMIEAMACGTPVLAFNCGSVPEIVEPGLTGFIVDSVEEAIAAVPALKTLDRSAIRRRFEQRFSARRMAEDHVSLYRRLLAPPARALVAVDAQTPRLQLKVAN